MDKSMNNNRAGAKVRADIEVRTERTRRPRLAALIFLLMCMTILPMTVQPAFAAAPTTPPPGGIEITGYTISTGSAQITKGTNITITMNILDTRIADPAATPPTTGITVGTAPQAVAVLNTAAFTSSNASFTTSGAAATAGGYAYTFTFSGLVYTGNVAPFKCSISYPAGVSPPLPAQDAVLTLNQLVEYVPPAPPDPPPEPKPGPESMFVLKDAWYGDGGGEAVYAGKPFTLTAVIMATNGASAIDNVTASFSPPEKLTFADGSSVSYIGTMSPGTSATINTALLPGANIDEGSYTITIDVKGVSRQSGTLITTSLTITVPILQPERFEIFNATFPTDLMANMDNGMGYGSITVVNKGRGVVSNVSLELVGDGLFTEDGRIFIGNVGAGEQRNADFNLLASMPGMIEAVAIISYENTRGEPKTLERPFTVNVMEEYFPEEVFPEGPDGGFPVEPTPSQGIPNWIWILIGAAAAVVVIVILVQRNKKKKLAREAALDDYDDD